MKSFKFLEQINEKRIGFKSVFVSFLSLLKEGNLWFQKIMFSKPASKFKTSFLKDVQREVNFC
jgi:hypothetical protein